MWPYHPYSELFPLLSDERAAELAVDIKARGLLEPITLYEGMILDGRNRYRACVAAEAEPRAVQYEGDDPVGWVLAKNLNRRHLTDDQRAMVGIEALPMIEAETEKRRRAAISLARSGETGRISVQSEGEPKHHPSQAAAAALVGVSPDRIARSKAVKQSDPELARDVAAGTKKLHEAEKEVKQRKSRRPELNPAVYLEGQVVKPPRPPRPDLTLHDRLYRSIGSGPSADEWRALAGEVRTVIPDLPHDAVKKLTHTISSENSARQDLARALRSLLDRSNGTP